MQHSSPITPAKIVREIFLYSALPTINEVVQFQGQDETGSPCDGSPSGALLPKSPCDGTSEDDSLSEVPSGEDSSSEVPSGADSPSEVPSGEDSPSEVQSTPVEVFVEESPSEVSEAEANTVDEENFTPDTESVISENTEPETEEETDTTSEPEFWSEDRDAIRVHPNITQYVREMLSA